MIVLLAFVVIVVSDRVALIHPLPLPQLALASDLIRLLLLLTVCKRILNFVTDHNWVEYFDSEASEWVFQNVPPTTATPDGGGPCASGSYTKGHGCDWNNETGCSNIARGPGLAARDHEIYAITWEHPSDDAVIDVQNLRLSSGEPVSPLVWSPRLTSPLGTPLKNVGLRVLNRTSFYRCAD